MMKIDFVLLTGVSFFFRVSRSTINMRMSVLHALRINNLYASINFTVLSILISYIFFLYYFS